MGISNFADWFVPTATTANDAAAEPEATDQAPQDFAALLAASYPAPLAVATPTFVPSTATERVVQTMEARPVAAAFTLPAELRATVAATGVAPPTTVMTPDVPITSSPELTSDDGRTDISPLETANQRETKSRMDISPLAVSSKSEPTSETNVSPLATTKDNNRMTPVSPFVDSPHSEFVAPARADKTPPLATPPRFDKLPFVETVNQESGPKTHDKLKFIEPLSPASEFASSGSTPALPAMAERDLLPARDIPLSSEPSSLSPSVEIPIARNEALPPLTSQRVMTSAPKDERLSASSAQLVPQDFSLPPVETDIKIENRTLTSTQPSATSDPLPEPLTNAPKFEMKADIRPAILASAQPVSSAPKVLSSTFGERLPSVTEVVKLAAAVVKTIVAEQARHIESLPTVAMKDMPAPNTTVVPASVASTPVASGQPSFFAPVNDVVIEAAPQTLPASLRAPQHKLVSQAQTPLPAVEKVENVGKVATTARAPLASGSGESLPPAFDNAPRVVANRAEAALPPPSLPLELIGRKDFMVEGVEAVTTGQTMPASPSVNASPPAVNVANTTPAPAIAQTMQPVLELAQSIPPNETRTLRFSLNPVELGRVEVEVTRAADGRVSASLTVEQADTAQALTHGIGQLRESLERAGLVVEQLQITTQVQSQTAQQFGQPAGQQAGQQQASQPHGPNADSLPTDQMVADGTTPVSENKLLSLHA